MRNTCTHPDCDRQAFGRGLCSSHYQLARYHGTLPELPPPRACERCGKMFEQRKWNARYCSKLCADAVRYQPVEQQHERCGWCHLPLVGKRGDAMFCDAFCGQKFNNKRRAEEARAEKVASRPPCPNCGKPLPVEKRTNSTYCSADCKREFRRAQMYGLTREEFDLLHAQHNACAICGKYDWGGKHAKPHVDHDHITGKVRGLLCSPCNQGLGMFFDSPGVLRRAAAYLER